MCQIPNSTAVNYFNSTILRMEGDNTLSSLREKQSKLQLQLYDLTLSINNILNHNVMCMTENMLMEYQKKFPCMKFVVDKEKLHMHFYGSSIEFHRKYIGDDVDNTVYRTMPIYTFHVVLAKTLITIKNETFYPFSHLHTANSLYSGIDETPLYSHPHVVGCNSRQGDAFAQICAGNNEFLAMLDRTPLDAGDIMEFLRSLGQWLTRANLDDSYHSLLYKKLLPREEMASPELAAFADRQYAWALRHVPPNRQELASPYLSITQSLLNDFKSCLELNPCHLTNDYLQFIQSLHDLPAIDESVTTTDVLLLFLQASYALWLYAASQRFPGSFLNADLDNALLTDLDLCLFSSQAVDLWHPRTDEARKVWLKSLLTCPRNLKRFDSRNEMFPNLEALLA